MNAQILQKPIEVSNRLAELGWSLNELLEVAEAMVQARTSCTENDPPSTPGYLSWARGTRRLRELGSLKGLLRNDDQHISSTFDSTRSLKFAVCNTDDATGIADNERCPQNRSKKGAAMEHAVASNQGVLGAILDEVDNVIQLSPQTGGTVYWYLCVYWDGLNIHAELSCPDKCEGGFFKSFKERIIISGNEGGSDLVRRRPDLPESDSGLEINVTRKRA